jgi:hypothetical protein
LLSNLAYSQQIAMEMEPSITSTTLDKQTIAAEFTSSCSCFYRPVSCQILNVLEPIENAGGHNHHSSTRPVGKLEPAGLTFYNGVDPVRVVYESPEISGDVTWRATATSECGILSVTRIIRVQMIGLVALPGSENYSLIGSYGQPGVNSMHSSNHWVTPAMSHFISNVASDFKKIFPDSEGLKINDGSLIWGGLFDISNDWRRPHSSHRRGNDIDLDDLSQTELIELQAIIEANADGQVFFLNEGNHYHIRFTQ